jgi:hypothetical protein
VPALAHSTILTGQSRPTAVYRFSPLIPTRLYRGCILGIGRRVEDTIRSLVARGGPLGGLLTPHAIPYSTETSGYQACPSSVSVSPILPSPSRPMTQVTLPIKVTRLTNTASSSDDRVRPCPVALPGARHVSPPSINSLKGAACVLVRRGAQAICKTEAVTRMLLSGIAMTAALTCGLATLTSADAKAALTHNAPKTFLHATADADNVCVRR